MGKGIDFYPSANGRHAGYDLPANAEGLKPFRAAGGLRIGTLGKQRRIGGPNNIEIYDDFARAAIGTDWTVNEGTDSATSDAAILAGGIGGVLRMTTGDAGTGLAADLVQITRPLQWQASNGGLRCEARFKLSAITTCYVFFGFTDVTTLEAPIISAASADTITTTATDAVGFMFDTRMATDNWWLVGVAADVDATLQNSGVAPVADTYAIFAVEVTAAGVATFFYNGERIGTRMTGALTPATDLTPTLAVGKTSVAASMTLDLDVIHISMNR